MNKLLRFGIFIFSFVIIFVISFSKVFAVTSVSGSIITDTTWTLEGSPYVIEDDLSVINNATLYINPGVVVKFVPQVFSYLNNSINVLNGKIIANGTEANPIYFTSSYDDTVGGDTDFYEECYEEVDENGNITGNELCDRYDIGDPSVEDWSGIYFSNSDGSIFNNVNLGYAKGGLSFYKSKANLKNFHIGDTQDALTVYENSYVDFSNLDIFNIYSDPVSVFYGSSLVGDKLNIKNIFTPHTDTIIVFNNSKLLIKDSSFKNCPEESCITVFDGNSYLTTPSEVNIENTIFDGGLGSGILTFSVNDIPINVSNSTFRNFNLFAIENYSGVTIVHAKDNDWDDTSGPYHETLNPQGLGEKIYGAVDFDPWVGKLDNVGTYYAKITNIPNGIAKLYDAPNTSSTLIKTLPNDWVVKVIEKKDINNQPMISGGYHWYKIEDPTDSTIHYMISGTDSKPIYLPYEKDKQAEYERISIDNLSGTTSVDKSKRRDVFLDILDHYYNNTENKNSLYSSNDTTHISSFKDIGFQKEIILAIVGQEISGAGFNNEIVTKDYGHGLMQVTMDALKHENPKNSEYGFKYNNYDPRGQFSKSKIEICKEKNSDQYKKCYENTDFYNELRKPYSHYDHNILNPIYKQYTNTIQSMYANVKDGLGILKDKYNSASVSSCKIGDYNVEGFIFSCNDIKKVKTIWYYNGKTLSPERNYMRDVSNKLKILGDIFPGIIYNNSDNLIEKLIIANRHRKEIQAHSPIEIRIKDSQNNITGLLNGESVSQMPNGIYDKELERVMILFPNDTYTYEVVGDSTGGFYGIDIDNYNGSDVPISFNASDLQIAPGEIHTYSVDETKLLNNKPDAVTVKIDTNGDGIIEKTIKTGTTLTSTEPYDFYFKKPTDSSEYKINKNLNIKIKITKDKDIKKIKIPKAALTITRISDGYVLPLNIKDIYEDDEQDKNDKDRCKRENKDHHKNYEWKIPKNSLTEGEWKIEVKLGDKVKHSININMIKS